MNCNDQTHRCPMCGEHVSDRSMTGWIAHRLAAFEVHYPWRGDRFAIPVEVVR